MIFSENRCPLFGIMLRRVRHAAWTLPLFGSRDSARIGAKPLANKLSRFAGMSMQGDASQHCAGRAVIGLCGRPPAAMARLITCLAFCLLAGGCGSIGIGQTPGARDIRIAFESIDGLPRDLSQKLAHDLNEEAAALRIVVVPAGEASYRLRGYLAAHPEGGTTAIAWAWDVYDDELHRAFRLSGEERTAAATPAGKNSEARNWAAADETLLRRIAHTGMEQLASFAASPPAPPAPASPPAERSGAAVASRDALPSEAVDPAANPRPPRTALTGTDRLADAAAGR
jgi:hypothetical protein